MRTASTVTLPLRIIIRLPLPLPRAPPRLRALPRSFSVRNAYVMSCVHCSVETLCLWMFLWYFYGIYVLFVLNIDGVVSCTFHRSPLTFPCTTGTRKKSKSKGRSQSVDTALQQLSTPDNNPPGNTETTPRKKRFGFF